MKRLLQVWGWGKQPSAVDKLLIIQSHLNEAKEKEIQLALKGHWHGYPPSIKSSNPGFIGGYEHPVQPYDYIPLLSFSREWGERYRSLILRLEDIHTGWHHYPVEDIYGILINEQQQLISFTTFTQ